MTRPTTSGPDLRGSRAEAAARLAGWGLALTLSVFVALTVFPAEPLRPWATSRFEVADSGLLRFSPPSLFHSALEPPFARLPSVREARFSVAFTVVPEWFGQDESSRVVSYSADEANPIFMFSQKREHLLIEHAGLVVYLQNLFEPGVRHRYVVVLRGDEAVAWVDGESRPAVAMGGVRLPWREGHLTVANEMTGDRPFFGEVGEVALIPRALEPEEAAAYRPSAPPGDALVLRHDAAEQRLWFEDASGARLELQRFAWPYRHKWSLGPPPYLSRRHLASDVVLNLVATIPVGVCWVLWGGRRFGRRSLLFALLGAGLLQLACSVGVEASQFFSMGRRFGSGLDVLTNTLGALLGAGAAQRLVR